MDPVLLILAGITAFILFRLISVMGTRTGHEQRRGKGQKQRPDLKVVPNNSAENIQRDDDTIEDVESAPAPKPVSTYARILHDADSSFDEKAFLQGGRSAYETIVESYADGDLRSIRSFLGSSVFDAFKQAVAMREQAGQVLDLKFIGIDHAAIVNSAVDHKRMSATVEFTSNQVRVTRDKEGNVVDGDPNRIELVKDSWTFERLSDSKDPNWMLVATGGGA